MTNFALQNSRFESGYFIYLEKTSEIEFSDTFFDGVTVTSQDLLSFASEGNIVIANLTLNNLYKDSSSLLFFLSLSGLQLADGLQFSITGTSVTNSNLPFF